MKKYIITISREFGCNAREVGRQLASALGVPFYDKDLVDLAANKAGVHVDVVKGSDEMIGKKRDNLFEQFGYGTSTSFFSESAITAQAEVIRELANKSTCVMFGRCADYILREYDNVFNIFIYAPLVKKIKHIAKDYDLTEKSAAKLIKRVDRQRHSYYKYVTGRNRGDRSGKHIMIDVFEFGYEGTVEILIKAITNKYPDFK